MESGLSRPDPLSIHDAADLPMASHFILSDVSRPAPKSNAAFCPVFDHTFLGSGNGYPLIIKQAGRGDRQ